MADSGRATTSPTHSVPLRVLFVEDSGADVELLLEELRRGGYAPTWERVDTATTLTAALERQPWDIITCDWVMPRFSGPAALALLQERQVDMPIIIVSGQVGEEYAVTAMKAGAHDYVSKHKLTRLVPAIQRELREAERHRAHRRAETALERERELVTSVLDTVGALVGVVDREGRIVRFNRACEQTLGYSFDEVRGRPFWDLLPVADEIGPAKTVFERLLAGKWPRQYETYWYTRQGGRIHLAWSTRCLANGAGEVEYVIGSGIDITERKRSEDALRASETRFRSLIEKSLDLIAIIDADGRYRYVNPAHEAAYGCRSDELVGTSAFAALHPDDARELAARLAEALRRGETRATVEYRIRHQDGSWHQVEGVALNLFDDPAVAGMLVTGHDITERRLAEQRLADALNYSQTMLDASPVGILTYAASGDAISANEACARLIGATLDQVKAQNFRTLRSWQESGLLAAAEKALATGQEQQIETHMISSFGKPVWLAVRFVPFQFAGETRLLTLSMDIGDRKRAEEALRHSENRFRTIFEDAPLGVALIDSLTGRIYEVNSRFAAIAGRTREQMTTIDWMSITHPDDVQEDLGNMARLNAGEISGFTMNKRYLRPDGSCVWTQLTVAPVTVTDPNHPCHLAMIDDITERKQAEEVLRTSEERFRRLSESAPVGIFETDKDGAVLFLNDRWCAITGLSQKEALGFGWAKAIHPEDAARILAEWRQCLTEKRGYRGEFRFRQPTGAVCWVFTQTTPVLSPSGEVILHLGVNEDITERKRAEEAIRTLNEELEQRVSDRTAQLEAANKELETFSYSVSHDLRAPLRHIDGFGKQLLEDYGDKLDERGKRCLERLQAGTQRMGQLIDDLLRLSRVTRAEMQWQEVDLSAMAKTVAAELRTTKPSRSVEFVIAPGVLTHGDRHLLHVVLENLLGNAWKYTSKHATARIEFGTVEVSGAGGDVAFFVRDDGAGFDMTYVDKLFGAFQRLHSTAEFEGTGIGLATVARIIRRHGGRIWAEGGVEQGATFYFTLREAAG